MCEVAVELGALFGARCGLPPDGLVDRKLAESRGAALEPSGSAACAGVAAGAKPPSADRKPPPCHYWAKGECRNGSDCRFAHG